VLSKLRPNSEHLERALRAAPELSPPFPLPADSPPKPSRRLFPVQVGKEEHPVRDLREAPERVVHERRVDHDRGFPGELLERHRGVSQELLGFGEQARVVLDEDHRLVRLFYYRQQLRRGERPADVELRAADAQHAQETRVVPADVEQQVSPFCQKPFEGACSDGLGSDEEVQAPGEYFERPGKLDFHHTLFYASGGYKGPGMRGCGETAALRENAIISLAGRGRDQLYELQEKRSARRDAGSATSCGPCA